MSLTKLLCKYMDNDERGYATIGDVFCLIFVVSADLVFVGGYFYGAWLSYHSARYSTEVSNFGGLSVQWFAVISLIIIIIVGVCVAAKLSSIRVATCERKEWDE